MLRDYQISAAQAVLDAIRDGARAVCLVLPTGAGKTITATAIAARTLDAHGTVLWLAHREELVDQAAAALARHARVSIVRAGDPRTDHGAQIVVASIPTLVARPHYRPRAALVVLDECHHVTATTWRALADDYRDADLLGLTATPERSDGSALGDVFRALVVGATYSALIRDGYLLDADVIAPPRRLRRAVASTPADAYLAHARGRPALVYTASVAESVACTRVLLDAGVRAAHVDGTTHDRSDVIESYRTGCLDVLSSCAVLTEGVDLPRAQVAVIARTCSSALTYLQIVGRVLRPDGSTSRALVLDLVGAVHEHGWPTEDRVYSLAGRPIRRAASAAIVIWQCRHCGHCQPHAPHDRLCPRCAQRMPEPEPLRVARARLERQARYAAASDADRRSDLRALVATARARGYAIGWALHRFRARYGRWPTRDERLYAEG